MSIITSSASVRNQWLFAALGLSIVALLYSRTQRGAQAVSDAADVAGVAVSRVKALAKSRGYRNNNPGNIEWIDDPKRRWRGMVDRDGRFGIFQTPQEGTRALGRQLERYSKRGLRSVRAIIYTWAPSNENDTIAYINDVARALRVDADDVLNVTARLPELAAAIAKHENGYVDDGYDWSWVYLP